MAAPVSCVSFSTSRVAWKGPVVEDDGDDSDEAFKESNTYTNLREIFIKETQAHRRYLYSAEIADSLGDLDAARTFRDAAESEARHATLIFDLLVEVGDPVTNLPLSTTADCLRSAIESEASDADEYIRYAHTARDEGYDSVADYLEEIAAAENKHERKFSRVLDDLVSEENH